MRLAATKSVKPGTKLAKTVYNENGQILIQEDVELTERMLQRLLFYKITYLYIHNSLTDGIEIISSLSNELRTQAYQTIKSSFSSFQKEAISKKIHLSDLQLVSKWLV